IFFNDTATTEIYTRSLVGSVKMCIRDSHDTEHIALVPGVDLEAFVVLSSDNPEHALFLLQPAPATACGARAAAQP
ncbi:MAG TPA: hypothetical protein DCQ79_11000, partial [Rhizobiales bacterium]|nr:hypothetical protein [Hyphomicrobiales bacterium]